MALSAAKALCLLVVLSACAALAADSNECPERTRLADGAVVLDGLCNGICSDFQTECPEYKCLCFYMVKGSCVLNLKRSSRFGRGFCRMDVITDREFLEAAVTALDQELGDDDATNIVWPWMFYPPSPTPPVSPPAVAVEPQDTPVEPEPEPMPALDSTPPSEWVPEPAPLSAPGSEWAPEPAPMLAPGSEWAPEPAPMLAPGSEAVPSIQPPSHTARTVGAVATAASPAAAACTEMNQESCVTLSLLETDEEQAIYEALDVIEVEDTFAF